MAVNVSKVYLLTVPLEDDMKNTLYFASASNQQSYFNSHIGKTYTNVSYQSDTKTFRCHDQVDTVRQYNYIMWQNTAYTNKWFYAFIKNMSYVSDGYTDVVFEVDPLQTWMFDITVKPSFIEREHTNNDSWGANTVPENLETGEYICNEHYRDSTMDSYSNDLCFVMASTSQPLAGEAKDTVAGSAKYNGVYTGLTYYQYDSTNPIDIMLEIFANYGKTDAINGVFMAPKWLAPLSGGVLRDVAQSDSPYQFDISVSKQATLNGYTPRNNKVKCFPYNYLLVSNNIGQNSIMHYEKFSASTATFRVKGVLNPGCSINLTPRDYNGSHNSDIDAIQLGKFPICNYRNDMYTNWLTQNSINVLGATITSDDINIAGSAIGSVTSMATNIAVGNYAGAGVSAMSGLSGVAGAVMQQKQHNMIPATIKGQLNAGDVNVASGNNTFHFYKMSVKAEYARIIDDFFDMYGYQTNRVKTPNVAHRQNWWYTKTINANITGNVPNDDMNKIKEAYNNGLTFWRNPANFLNYSVSNGIV